MAERQQSSRNRIYLTSMGIAAATAAIALLILRHRAAAPLPAMRIQRKLLGLTQETGRPLAHVGLPAPHLEVLQPQPLPWERLASTLDTASLNDPAMLRRINESAAEFSHAMNRKLLNAEELAKFIDPEIPIEAIWTQEKTLGAGCFRQVRLFQTANAPVAIKETHISGVTQYAETLPNWFKQAKNEFEIGLSLNHQNVVKIHHFALKRIEGQLRAYTICEYVPGSTLAGAKELSSASQLDLMNQLATTFRDMREAKVLASDLHSENVMVTPSNVLKFIDLEFWERGAEASTIDSSAGDWLFLARMIPSKPPGISNISLIPQIPTAEQRLLACVISCAKRFGHDFPPA